eukprot:Sspe_Gene.109639::Locus_89801_Transcript_1_2_Confidence_0.600_Length_616::g.109639::m.109639
MSAPLIEFLDDTAAPPPDAEMVDLAAFSRSCAMRNELTLGLCNLRVAELASRHSEASQQRAAEEQLMHDMETRYSDHCDWLDQHTAKPVAVLREELSHQMWLAQLEEERTARSKREGPQPPSLLEMTRMELEELEREQSEAEAERAAKMRADKEMAQRRRSSMRSVAESARNSLL